MARNTTRPATNLAERVLAHITGYPEAIQRHRRLIPFTADLVNQGEWLTELDRAYATKITAAIDAGATNLDDLRNAYVTERAAGQSRGHFALLVRDAAERARADLTLIQAAGADEALDYLRTELSALYADVRTHRDIMVNHPANAEAALHQPDGAARWDLVTGLLQRYEEVRAEARKYAVMQNRDITSGTGFALIGQTHRFLAVEPHWQHLRATSHGPTNTTAAIRAWFSTTAMPFVPEDVNRQSLWPHQYRPVDWLLTLADEAQPWLPDGDVIGEARRLADQLITADTTDWFVQCADQLNALGITVDVELPIKRSTRSFVA
ncbi:hypothetical protein [Mycolicibacterium komossense]|uniref:Uncharacterized protein n=1 Tax=Mycolicibacterium komossense TaxID=1779 RepID=A0ABT3CLQ1_9MYCO|nr:hypothetical protein [Mycolicibacterium komossense]MCV7230421.1 hypothetical protein [Mycolicibacterium komossense]